MRSFRRQMLRRLGALTLLGTITVSVSSSGVLTVAAPDARTTKLTKVQLAAVGRAASTASGSGYWLVGADGGVFTFGSAGFFGSMGGTKLNAPVIGIVPTPDGRGYWLGGGRGC